VDPPGEGKAPTVPSAATPVHCRSPDKPAEAALVACYHVAPQLRTSQSRYGQREAWEWPAAWMLLGLVFAVLAWELVR
jgi:hypothetical protein